MNLDTRIRAFSALGKEIEALEKEEAEDLARRSAIENPWFTAPNVHLALSGIARLLTETELRTWTRGMAAEQGNRITIGVAMAGNIPLVGFHDALAVLISGHRLRAKLSSQDTVLMKELFRRLIAIEPQFGDFISIEDRLNDADAMIATGGNNTARYFEYYFRNIPHIIRKNRSSCAILSGTESPEDLDALHTDVFSYFGLGCRNVSKLFIPAGYDFIPLMARWETDTTVANHHKYANNYDYQRGIMLINQIPFYDNGVVLLREENAMVSPIAVLYYAYYHTPEELAENLKQHAHQLQCVVSAAGWYPGSEAFGQAQFPRVSDYADGIDTLKFLETAATDPSLFQANR